MKIKRQNSRRNTFVMYLLKKIYTYVPNIYKFNANINGPENIYIELTNVCNLKCPLCPRTYSDQKRGHIDNQLFFEIIDTIQKEYPSLKHLGFHFFGAIESKKDFDILIKYARKKLINTNFGVSLNLSFTNFDIDKILDCGFDSISIWPDAGSKEIYNLTRVGGNFDLVKSNITKLIQKRGEKNLSDNLKIHIGMVINKNNYDSIRKFKQEFAFITNYKNCSITFVNSHDWAGQIPSNNTINNINKYRFLIPKPCRMPFNTLIVAANGDSTLCCYDNDLMLKIGNFNNYKSIKKMWNNKISHEIRNNILNLNMPKICSKCYSSYLDYYLDYRNIFKIIKKFKQLLNGITLHN